MRVLIVDDEPQIRRLLRTCLSSQGYDVLEAEDGASSLAVIASGNPDVLVLDLGLAEMDGFEVIQRVRRTGSPLPIVVISSRDDEAGKVRALDLGADDYVTKPFGVNELLARVRTALRHRLQQDGLRTIFQAGDLSVDTVRHVVTRRDEEVKLTPLEFKLLQTLVAHAGKVLTHNFIISEVWGGHMDVQYLRIYIRSLRLKLEDQPALPRYILTEQGVGYRLVGSQE